MGAAYFYHLTDNPLERTLPMLLGKCRDAGWRVAVRGRDAKMLQGLDVSLWRDGFLPHGLAGGAHDADQPVLLGDAVSADGFDCVMSVDGADVTAEEIEAAQRVCILFDGYDEGALNHARGQWKALTGAGCSAQYWAQEDGRWTKKAES
jgi:DNA polymerase-3 subunit chi